MAWSLGKNVDDITEPADLSADVQRLVEKWGPLVKFLYYVLRVIVEAESFVRAVASQTLGGLNLVLHRLPT